MAAVSRALQTKNQIQNSCSFKGATNKESNTIWLQFQGLYKQRLTGLYRHNFSSMIIYFHVAGHTGGRQLRGTDFIDLDVTEFNIERVGMKFSFEAVKVAPYSLVSVGGSYAS
jgi:hypothetical protein